MERDLMTGLPIIERWPTPLQAWQEAVRCCEIYTEYKHELEDRARTGNLVQLHRQVEQSRLDFNNAVAACRKLIRRVV